MLEAEISLRYSSPRLATAVTAALIPDNKLGGGKMRISTHLHHSTVKIVIENCSRVETLQATIRDLFRCLHAAEAFSAATERRYKP